MSLPDRWIGTTIGDLAELVNGRPFKPSEWTEHGLPIIRIQNLNRSDLPFNRFSGLFDERHRVRTGDLLFAWSGTPGTSFGAHIWNGGEAILNQHIFNMHVDPDQVDKEFLAAAINRTLDAQIAKAHGGAGLRHVTKSAFQSTPIALPPLAEQKRIVAKIRSFEQRIKSVERSLDQAEIACDRGRAKLLAGAFEMSLLPWSREEKGAIESQRVTVGDVATQIIYGSSAKSSPTGDVAVLRMGNIQDGELDWTNLVYTSDLAEISRYRLEPGDVLFNRTNGSPQLVGKSAVYNGEIPAIHAGYLIRIRCSERILPEYLAYCLNSPAGRAYWLAVRSDSSGQSNVNARKLAAFELICPPLVDQRKICEIVSGALQSLKVISVETKGARITLGDLRTAMLDAALEGRLGTGDETDRPVSTQFSKPKIKRPSPRSRGHSRNLEIVRMKKSVAEILQQTGTPLPAQQLAELCDIRADATLEDIEAFYAELRCLTNSDRLSIVVARDTAGAKLGDVISLKAEA